MSKPHKRSRPTRICLLQCILRLNDDASDVFAGLLDMDDAEGIPKSAVEQGAAAAAELSRLLY